MPRANMDIILLEHVENLGDMGEVVQVRPGYARNFLLPKQKALRATKENKAYFEAQREALEKRNEENRKAAEKEAKKLEGVTVSLIRHASDAGQLYGSVNARDIADALSAEGKPDIARSQIKLNQSIKTVGLFQVPVALHPEVRIDITVNVARNEEEAKIQKKTGKAVVAEEPGEIPSAEEKGEEEAAETVEGVEGKTEEFFEEGALEQAKKKAEEKAEEKAGKKEKEIEEKVSETAAGDEAEEAK